MKPSFGLYVHIPYCLKKCPYCDFNSYAVKNPDAPEVPEHRYREALARELQTWALKDKWKGRSCHSVFFGGGTPSLLSPETFQFLLTHIRHAFSLGTDTEVTMETNPGTIHEELGEGKLRAIRDAGVNRVSLGVQSFSERKRKLLGRWHGTEDILKAIENIRSSGFENYSFDFIYATPGETLEEWHADMQQAIALRPSHLSAYGLTIEPGTEFGRLHKKGKFTELDEELQAALYTETERVFAENGYEQYEISNYAHPGKECRHNLGYWSGEDYLGLGAGAHSFFGGDRPRRWVNFPGPEHYMTSAGENGNAVQREEALDEAQQRMEFFFLRLRTAAGAASSDYKDRFHEALEARYTPVIAKFVESGLLKQDGANGDARLSLTRKGFLFSNTVFDGFAAAS